VRRRSALRKYGVVLLLLSPWIIGFIVFTGGPMVISLFWSFTHYDMASAPRWIGLENYKFMFGIGKVNGVHRADPYFWQSVKNTLFIIVFGVPLRGSLWVLFSAAALFLLAALGMGLLISTVTKNQFVAGQLAIITTFLPAFILSGFIFDIGSMPRIVQWLTHVLAASYFVAILQTVFLAGNVWSVILPNALALLLMAAFFLGLSRRKLRKRLE